MKFRRFLLAGCVIFLFLISSSCLSFIRAQSSDVVATIPLPGGGYSGITFDPNNGNLYAANYGTGEVDVISGSSNTVIASIPNPCPPGTCGSPDPQGVAFDPNNGYIYVGNYGSNTVSVIDGSTNVLIENIAIAGCPTGGVACPQNVVFDPANGDIYATGDASHYVFVIDGKTNTVIATIDPPTKWTSDLAFDPKNGYLYATGVTGSDGFVYAIDSATNQIVNTIELGSAQNGIDPTGIAYDPNNGYMYVANLYSSNGFSNVVTIVDPRSSAVVGSITVGSGPYMIAFDSSNGNLYVADQGWDQTLGSFDVSVISGSSNVLVDTIAAGNDQPWGIAFDPVNCYMYVNTAGQVVVIGSTTTSTSTSLNCTPNQVLLGGGVTCTAVVTGSAPTGQISFTTAGTGALSPASQNCGLDATGSCTVQFTGASIGSVPVTASYSGDSSNSPSSGQASVLISNSITIELNQDDGSIVCPIAPLYGAWNSNNNTCTISQNEYYQWGITVQVDPGVTLLIASGGSLTVNGVLNNQGTINVESGATLSIMLSEIDNTGNFNNGTLANYGLIVIDGTIHVTGSTFDNFGTFIVGSSGFVDIHASSGGLGTMVNEAGGRVANNGMFVDHGIVTNDVGGTIMNNFSQFQDSGILNNYGNFMNHNGVLMIFPNINTQVSFNNWGTLNNVPMNLNAVSTIGNAGTLDNEIGGTITNNGGINDQCGAVFTNSGELDGNPVTGGCSSSVVISPNPVYVIEGNTIPLTVTVTNTGMCKIVEGVSGTLVCAPLTAPTGIVTLFAPGLSSPATCTLVTSGSLVSTCTFTYTAPNSLGMQMINVMYSGDWNVQSSIGQAQLGVYDFSVALLPVSTATLIQGTSNGFSVGVNLVQGSPQVSGSVQLSLNGLPSGIIASGFPSSLQFGGSAIFTLNFQSTSQLHSCSQVANKAGQNLQNANLQGCNLAGYNLQGSNLQGANLQYADLQGANLAGANLQRANLGGANTVGTNFKGANMQSAQLSSATNIGSFTMTATGRVGNVTRSASLTVTLSGEDDIAGDNFQGANLQNANLMGDYGAGAIFQGANLQSVNLSGGNFAGSNFQGSNLQNANMQNGNFANCNFQGANTQGANTTGANFAGSTDPPK